MTPFMRRVVNAVGMADGEVVAPATRASAPKPVSVGADDQVAVRSLAEQLVCEANAVLSGGQQIALTDELLDGQLSFSLRYGKRCARVATRFSSEAALARLTGDPNVYSGPRELTGPSEIERLILLLLADPEAPARIPGPTTFPNAEQESRS